MTIETELGAHDLLQRVPHLVNIADEGWSLRWAEAKAPPFEVVCSGATLAQIQHLEKSLSKAYQKACARQ